ncbi:hypothetical protein X997_5699 [Burkholderia pseudomallei A79C]|nr:hypothetical protein X997_5699 [Burkholderia pseudomallei A79C]
MNKSGGTGTASLSELLSAAFFAAYNRFERVGYSSFHAMHAPDRRETREAAPRQGRSAHFRGFCAQERRRMRTTIVQCSIAHTRQTLIWCSSRILHRFSAPSVSCMSGKRRPSRFARRARMFF